MADGEDWERYRGQLRPQFTRERVSHLASAEGHLQALLKALPAVDCRGEVEVDLMPLFYDFTMDAATEFLFGKSVHNQQAAIAAADSSKGGGGATDMTFIEAFQDAKVSLALRARLGPLVWLHRSAGFRRACRNTQRFTDRAVAHALQASVYEGVAGEERQKKFVLLDALVAETKNPAELRDQCLQLLLAGRDTTSALLSWLFLMLSRHPSTFARLRVEALALFPADGPPGAITSAALKAQTYLQCVINETLRLYPLVPVNARTCVRDTVLPEGGGLDGKSPVVVAKGSIVAFSSYVMQRRPDIWGADAHAWRPERWIGRKMDWSYIPFNGGPRVCIGREFLFFCIDTPFCPPFFLLPQKQKQKKTTLLSAIRPDVL